MLIKAFSGRFRLRNSADVSLGRFGEREEGQEGRVPLEILQCIKQTNKKEYKVRKTEMNENCFCVNW